jgi:glycosyltransferase involved in cell wall biosynthesis
MDSTTSPISAIVPARNEERDIEDCVRSLAAQPEIGEVLVINDHSSDRTGTILSELAGELPKLRVLESPPLPEGWVGKNHAAWTGARQAQCRWLLFTDADVTHLPGSAHLALVAADATRAAMVSFSPEQETNSWSERALIPFVYTRLATKFSYEDVSDPGSPVAAANGQYLMIRRDAYDAIGGHRAVAGEVLEDLALARRAKHAGFRLYFARGERIARTRMYHTFGAMWEGWTKNLYPLAGGRPWRALVELLRAVPWFSPMLLLLWRVHPVLPLAGALVLLFRHAEYGARLRRYRYPLSGIIYFMPGALLYAAVLLSSAASHAQGTVLWKGRAYPVAE